MTSALARYIGFFGVLFIPLFAHGKDLPKANPSDGAFVYDEPGMLSMHERNLLITKLKSYNDSTSNEFAVVIESSLEDEALEERAITIANAWGLGKKNKDNGVLIYIANKEHKINIQIGRGLEGRITDGESERVIRNIIQPRFEEGKYYEGINNALDRLFAVASGEFENDGGARVPLWVKVLVVLIIILILVLWSSGGRTYSGKRHTYWGPWTWGGGSSSGGGFGGGFGSGGGFGGFGGGSFGGGGASGGWK